MYKYIFHIVSFIIMIFFVFLTNNGFVAANEESFSVTGEYVMSDDEIKSIAQERAVQLAMSQALMQTAVYVKSSSVAKDNQVDDDVVQAVVASLIKVKDKRITSTITTNMNICIKAELQLSFDYDEIEKYLPEIMSKWELIEKNRQLRLAYDEVTKNIALLKEQLSKTKDENERRYIREQIAVNEAQFSAVQWYEKGSFFGEKKEYSMAIECFSKAIEQDPQKADYLVSRGYYNFESGKIESALTDYTHAIKLDNKCDEAYYHRAWLYFVKGEKEAALADYSQVIKLFPKHYVFAAYTERGGIYLASGKYNEALADFNMAISLNKTNVTGLAMAYYARADAYRSLGNKEMYEKDKKMALQLKPDFYNEPVKHTIAFN